jgi:hypothetical protein
MPRAGGLCFRHADRPANPQNLRLRFGDGVGGVKSRVSVT